MAKSIRYFLALIIWLCVLAQAQAQGPTVSTAFKSLQIGNPYPGGGSLGNGTINASGGFYVNGTLITGSSGGQVNPLPVPPNCTLYVATGGSGTTCSSGSPCALSYAESIATAGNTVCLDDGTYAAPITVTNSGTQSQPIWFRPTNIVQVITPANAVAVPTVKIYATTTDHGIVGSSQSYINIYGLEFDGSGNGASLFGMVFAGAGTKHIGYYNNYVHDWGHAGISCNNADYCTIQGNVVFANGAAGSECDSNISIYEPVASDTSPGTHMYVGGNISHGALQAGGGCLDGEGIILDDFDNSQSTNTHYTQLSIVENNIVYGNISNGIEVFQNTDGLVVIRNNTAYHNYLRTTTQTLGNAGEIQLLNVARTQIGNNIVWPSSAPAAGGAEVGFAQVNAQGSVYNNTNMCNTDGGLQFCFWNVGTYTPGVPSGLFNINPLFQNPAANNFTLQPTSPAIGVGNGTFGQPITDILGFIRGGAITLGAYTFASNSNVAVCTGCSVADIPLWTGSLFANSALSDNGSVVTSTEPITAPNITASALTPNRCVRTTSGGQLTVASSDCNTTASPVTIIGTQTNGTDQVTHVNVNGYFNPVTYGADPTGVANSCAAIQAAMDAACASGPSANNPPTVDIPAGVFKCEQPLWSHCGNVNNIRIKGAGEFATDIKSTFTGDILVLSPTNVFSSGGGTLVPSLATGSGNAFYLSGSSAGFIDLNRAMSLNVNTSPISGPFNGLSQFDVRAFFKIGTVATHQETIWASDGPMGQNCGTAGACTQGLWVSTDGVLHGQLKVNGTLVKLNSGATTVTGGNCYETELSYDGAHVNLYLGGNGTSSCASSPGTVTRVAQSAATGNVTQTADEQNDLFADYNVFWSASLNFTGEAVDLTTDSIQISKTARNSAASYTQDTSKFSTDSNTLFLWNYDQTPTFAANSPIAKITAPANTFVTWNNHGVPCCGGFHEVDDLQVEGGGSSGAAILGNASTVGLNRVLAGNIAGGKGTISDGILTSTDASFNSYANDVEAGQAQRFGLAMMGGITKVIGYGQEDTSSGFMPFMIGGGQAQEIYIAPNVNTRCGVVMARGDTTLKRVDEDAENGGTANGICVVPDFVKASLYSVKDSDIFGVGVAPIQIEGAPGGAGVGELLLESNTISSTAGSPQVVDTSASAASVFLGPITLLNDICSGGTANLSCIANGWSVFGNNPVVPYCITDSNGSNCYSPFVSLPTCSSVSNNQKITIVDALGPCVNGQPAFAGGTTSCNAYCDGSSTWRYSGATGQFTNLSLNQGVITPYAVSFVDGHITFGNSTTCTASTGNITCNVPSGTVDNDGLMMCIAGFHTGSPWVAPGGWGTAIASSTVSSNNAITCFPRVSAGSEAGTPYTFTSANGGTDLSRANGIMIDYKGTNTSTLVETSGASSGRVTAASTSAIAPSITTSTADDLLLTAMGFCGVMNILPPGQTTRINTPYVDGPNNLTALYAGDETLLLSGATGTRTATVGAGNCDDGGLGVIIDWGAANIALKPNASSGSTHNIDWSLANNEFRTLADSVTYTFSNVPSSTSSPQYLNVRTCEDSTGGRTVAFPGTVKWPGGTQPSMTTTANYCTIWQFEADNSNVYGSQVADAIH